MRTEKAEERNSELIRAISMAKRKKQNKNPSLPTVTRGFCFHGYPQ